MCKRLVKSLAVAAALVGGGAAQAADVVSPGYLKFEYFGGIGGTAVSVLTGDARYAANTPDGVLWMPAFETRTILPADDHNDYGARISGFIVPEVSGDYDFFISSDDASELWLSTDENPANLVKIAEEIQCCAAFQEPGAEETTASPITLEAGQRYAVQLLLKEGGGGDYARVAMRKTDDFTPAAELTPIPGYLLAANTPDTGTISITSQPQDKTVAVDDTAVFSVAYNATFPDPIGNVGGTVNGNAASIQWFRDGVAIPGATGSAYVIPKVQATDAGAEFTARLSVPGLTTAVTTTAATLTVGETPAPTPGFLMYEYFGPGITGATIFDLQGAPRYIANNPNAVLWMPSLNSRTVLPADDHENYGARISGYIVPTETANYDFFISSDDASQLWLSTDDTKLNLTLLAEETGCCTPFQETGIGAPETTMAPVSLVAGQRYAVEVLLKEGGGGDYVQVAWRKEGDTTPATALQPIPGTFLAAHTPTGGTVTITEEPADVTVAENAPASFTVAYTATPPPVGGTPVGNMNTAAVSIQWFNNGEPIEGATGTTLNIPFAKTADNGAIISARVSTAGASATTEATFNVTADVVAPTVVSVTTGSSFTNITLTFSEPITEATATAMANYAISGGLAIEGISQVNPTTVQLQTSAQTPGTDYTLTLNNLRDTAAAGGGNAIAANTEVLARAFVLSNGAIQVDRFFNISGGMAEFEADPRFPNDPDDTVYWTVFGPFSAGNNYGDNYGARITGWITPPLSGTYKFFLRSDDASRVSLSSDETPENALPIAEQTACCNAFTDAEGTLSSVPIELVAGERYWVEALLKEGGGDDYLQLAWRTPADPNLNDPVGLTPIPGEFLQTYIDPVVSLNITNQPVDVNGVANTEVSFSVGYEAMNSSLGNFASVQWQKAPAGSSTFADIEGATGATYTIPFADPADSGAQFRAIVSVLELTNVTSEAASLTLTVDSVLPTVTGVTGNPGTVFVSFSEPLDATSAALAANYAINNGVTVNSATVISGAAEPGVVQLDVSGDELGSDYTISISGIEDRAGNVMANTQRNYSVYSAFFDFNSSTLPPGAVMIGSTTLLPSGVLELTASAGSLQGAFNIADVADGMEVTNLLINFDLFIGEGSGNPADGFSVSFGSDILANTSAGEEGAGTGVIVTFDTYDNAGGEAPAVGVKVFGTEIATTVVAKEILVNDEWVNVSIRINDNGTMDVIHDGVTYYEALDIAGLGGYFPITGGRFLFGARTGGEWAATRIDDVSIIVNGNVELPDPDPEVGELNMPTIAGNNLTISWTGEGVLQQSATVDGEYTNVSGVTGTSHVIDLSTSGSSMFFRLSSGN